MTTACLTLTDAQFLHLRDLVHDRAGITFQPSKKYVLETRLSRRIAELGLDDFDDYLNLLTSGPTSQAELQELFDRITINETSFFRNEPQLEVFEHEALPRLIEARNPKKRLRIWSAACSTGQEPYTLAMQVHRALGVRFGDWGIDILGTDLSGKALDVARKGTYAPHSVRAMPPAVLSGYFIETRDGFQIDPTIASMVSFNTHNLKDQPPVQRRGRWDVIFCRNVMIYFDDAMKTRCARMFHEALADDGVLFIGHSESLRHIAHETFDPLPMPQAFGYMKRPAC